MEPPSFNTSLIELRQFSSNHQKEVLFSNRSNRLSNFVLKFPWESHSPNIYVEDTDRNETVKPFRRNCRLPKSSHIFPFFFFRTGTLRLCERCRGRYRKDPLRFDRTRERRRTKS